MMQKSELRTISCEIANQILDAKIAGLDESSRNTLFNELLDKSEPSEQRWFDISASWSPSGDHYGNGRTTMRASLNQGFSSEPVLDEESGDYFRDYTVNVIVNWASASGEDPIAAALLERLTLYREVTVLAASLSMQYSGDKYRVLVQTKEDHEAEATRLAASLVNKKVKARAESLVKSMRVWGSERVVVRALFSDILDGTYEVAYKNKYDTKIYKITLNPYRARIIRTQ